MRVKVKKGLDLQLEGALPSGIDATERRPSLLALCPEDFPGLTPRPAVKEGDAVEAGTPLITDKRHPEIALVSPSAGHVKAVVRGERRRLLRVEVEVSDTGKIAVEKASLLEMLQRSGLWAMMRQRPYDVVPEPDVRPRDIFVTAFDSAPLAPEMGARQHAISHGVAALKTLTDGNVYIGHRPGALDPVEGAVMVEVEGPHPSGNPGVLAANVAPVNKGETVWTLDIRTLAAIGDLVETGAYDPRVEVAVVGPEVKEPYMAMTLPGAQISTLTQGHLLRNDDLRIISGNVFTGTKVGEDDFLRWPYRQVTVIREGAHADEFMGWASLSPKKMSENPTFLGKLLGRRFRPDARLLGGRRAMIMSEVYDPVFPMDIMPEYLIKAIIARDIEQMEALGIYEVAPEDFGPAEYIDPSKLELQSIVRQGLDYLKKELS